MAWLKTWLQCSENDILVLGFLFVDMAAAVGPSPFSDHSMSCACAVLPTCVLWFLCFGQRTCSGVVWGCLGAVLVCRLHRHYTKIRQKRHTAKLWVGFFVFLSHLCVVCARQRPKSCTNGVSMCTRRCFFTQKICECEK